MSNHSFKIFVCLCIGMLLASCHALWAQRIICPEGVITSKEDRKAFMVDRAPAALAFNRADVAKKAFEGLKENAEGADMILADAGTYEADEEGFYVIENGVAENGAIIFTVMGGEPQLVLINGRQKIDVQLSSTKELGEVVKEGKLPGVIVPKVAISFDEWLRAENDIATPVTMGQPGNRMIFQPYMIDCAPEIPDTLRWCNPMVVDGKEYAGTQMALMGFDMRHDKLYKYINKERSLDEKMPYEWRDSVRMPDPLNGKYKIKGFQAVYDYSGEISMREVTVISGIRRPFRNIDYSCATSSLDYNDETYSKKKPRAERKDESNNLNLTFLYASAELDPANPKNETELETLQSSLLAVFQTKGATVQEIRFLGVSSPEGSYAGNLNLSKARIATVKRAALSKLPASRVATLFAPEDGTVAPWDSVVPLLQQRGLYSEAQQVQDICNAVKDHDVRSSRIGQLSCYETIKTVFPDLRKVTCFCKFEIRRAPKDREILQEYNTDPDYRAGRGKNAPTLYEYWRLFHLLKDSVPPLEMENLYKCAIKASGNNPWHLPANLLAESYLRRDTFDLNILRPYIQVGGIINQVGGTKKNQQNLVANQVLMYLKAFRTDTARVLADILPDIPEFTLHKALAHIDQFQDTKYFSAIQGSCARNEVVVNLAMDNPSYNNAAEMALEQLDKNEALYWYFKAVIDGRKGESGEEDTIEDLFQCWKRSPVLHRLADNDGDLNTEFVGYAEQEFADRLADEEAAAEM